MSVLKETGEFGLIRRIRRLIEEEGARGHGVLEGLGDDTAVLEPRSDRLVLATCDAMVEGRHYSRDFMTLEEVGRRAMAMNISDIGAMGGRPAWALVSLGIPEDIEDTDILELYRGFLKELNPMDAAVVGGNITGADRGLLIDVTLLGEVERGRMVTRAGARPGDRILVTGYPGQAAAGLKILIRGEPLDTPDAAPLVRAYKTPAHRARAGRAAAETGRVTAMVDISDGFLGDLGHIREESGVGAVLHLTRLPLSDALLRAAEKWGLDPLETALEPSDDYELVLTCAPEDVPAVKGAICAAEGLQVTEVGRITQEPGCEIVKPDGSRAPAAGGGWDHFKSN